MTLGSQVATAVKWMAMSKVIVQAINWASTLLVIRLLSPDDYGLMAIASIFIGVAMLFQELGIQASIIQKKEEDPELFGKLYGFSIILNLSVFALLFLSAYPIARFFNAPELLPIIQVLSLQFPVLLLATIQTALAKKRLMFRQIAMIQIVESAITAPFNLALAMLGFGVWTLVFGALLLFIVRVCGYLYVIRERYPPIYSTSGIVDALKFGGFVTGSRILWFIYTKADGFVIGKILGTTAAGFYYVALQIATLPVSKLSSIINDVGFSSFSRAHQENESVEWYFLKAIGLLSAATVPVFVGISAVADPFVRFILGENWIEAIPLLQVIALIVPFRMMNSTLATPLMAVGRPDVVFTNNVITTVALPLAFFAASLTGNLFYVALVWPTVFPVVFLLILLRSARVLNFSLRKLLRRVSPIFLSAAVMFSAVFTLERAWVTNSAGSTFIELVSLSTLGAVLYLATLWLLAPRLISEAWQFFKKSNKSS